MAKVYGDKCCMKIALTLPPAAGLEYLSNRGKTTLFKMIIGKEKPDAGSFQVGETVQIAYVDQEHDDLKPDETVWQAITGGNELMELGGKQINSRAYVGKFNFNGNDQQKKVRELSGGMRNRVHLAIALKQGGNILLLDEPTNDLDINTLRALEEALDNFGGCAVIISHDRWFLDRVCTHILAFEGDSPILLVSRAVSDYEETNVRTIATRRRIA